MRLSRLFSNLSLIFFVFSITIISCGKEISVEIPHGIEPEDSTGVWVIKTMTVKGFYDTSVNVYASGFEYDTILHTITFNDSLFYGFNSPGVQPTLSKSVYSYDSEGRMISVTQQTPGQPVSWKVTVVYGTEKLPLKFVYEKNYGPSPTIEVAFNWQRNGTSFFGKYIDPSFTSGPYSFGDRRFLVNSDYENESTYYISQDTANYPDNQEVPVRNQAGEVIGERYLSRINGTSQWVLTDSIVYVRDNQSKAIYNFYRIWAGGLHWYNDSYSIGFTEGLTRYTDIFDYDKQPMIKKTHYKRDNFTDPLLKYDEETMQITYDANRNPGKLILFDGPDSRREVTLTWQKIEW